MMSARLRRRFWASLAIGSAFVFVAPAYADYPDPLASMFENPPASARPRVWWHWMNGNVTIDGIDKDLDWMERIGIGGVQNFDASLQTPQIVPKRLVYMEPDWKAAFRHAVETAEKKGLEFAIAASPGWSETGGPWVKPEDGMKKLVWSETVIRGGKKFKGTLAAPPAVTGPWQNAKLFDFIAAMGGGKPAEPPRTSGNIAVIAVASVSDLGTPQVQSTEGNSIEWSTLSDGDPDSSVDVPTGSAEAPGGLIIAYPRAVTIRSVRFFIPHAKPPFGSVPYQPVFEAEVMGKWQPLATLTLGEASTTASFAAVKAQRFRMMLNRNSSPQSAGLGGGAPGAETFNPFAQSVAKTVKVGEIQLFGNARINAAEAKAGFDIVNDYAAIADESRHTGLSVEHVINLSDKVRPDGTLDWTPPTGTDWRIYRFGWSLTGKTNHPATPEATGLEVDKYDAAAVRRYLETYLAMYRETVGDDLIGKRGIRALLTDSIEVGPSNWTPKMAEQFRLRRGYDLLPWLPALAGEVVGSAADSEKFLSDYRQTLAELLADSHYGTIAKVAHENGLIVYGEAHENGRPVLGDDLAMRKHTDIPMAALWTWGRDEKPRSTLIGDMKGAASVGHIYGQNIVAAESMTSANAPWAFAPADLKRVIDLEFANGINRPIIHTSVHQPVDDKKPGLSLMIFGQYFNRHESWAEMAKPWMDYLSRTSFMLQQGRNHADIAYFYGEQTPVTGLFEFAVPAGLPTKYAFDFVNADMLQDALIVENGEILARGGARYKTLYLGEHSRSMTLKTLKRLSVMVSQGATLIGEPPRSSPALKEDQAEFAALVQKLWNGPRVHATSDVEAGMAAIGVGPDFAFTGGRVDSEILFVHRKLADGDVYFLNNRQNQSEQIEARFRIRGKQPEIWRAIEGKPFPVSYRIEGSETIVPLNLRPEDALFVVFRRDATTTNAEITEKPPEHSAPLKGPWSVAFQKDRGAPATIVMDQLSPLNENTIAGIKYFSGVATYTKQFALPAGHKIGLPAWLNLGAMYDIAEVRVNGQLAGTTWHQPHRLDIGSFLKKGTNVLEIRVANLWVNRLIGDKQQGAAKVTFTAAPTYKVDAPLRPSGLIGPVTIEY